MGGGLRGVVTRLSEYSIGLEIEGLSLPPNTGGGRGEGEGAGAEDGTGGGEQERKKLLRLAKSVLGLEARVDYLANDATHARNLAALTELKQVRILLIIIMRIRTLLIWRIAYQLSLTTWLTTRRMRVIWRR